MAVLLLLVTGCSADRVEVGPVTHDKAQSLLAAGRYDEAVMAFAEVLRHQPGSTGALNGMGVAQDRLGHHEAARFHYRRALLFAPESVITHNNLGLSMMLQGRFDLAVVHLGEALRLAPHDAAVSVNHHRASAALRYSASRRPDRHVRPGKQRHSAIRRHNGAVQVIDRRPADPATPARLQPDLDVPVLFDLWPSHAPSHVVQLADTGKLVDTGKLADIGKPAPAIVVNRNATLDAYPSRSIELGVVPRTGQGRWQ